MSMPRCLFFAIFAATLLSPALASAAGKRAQDLNVSFHLQAEPGDRNVFKQLTAGKAVSYTHLTLPTSDLV